MEMSPTRQLDIFEDSRDVMLRNDLAQAVLDGRESDAEHVRSELQADFPHDPVLADAALVIGALHGASDTPLAGASEVQPALFELD